MDPVSHQLVRIHYTYLTAAPPFILRACLDPQSGQKSGSADVYLHEMPGGQYTNLLFQSSQLGLSGACCGSVDSDGVDTGQHA